MRERCRRQTIRKRLIREVLAREFSSAPVLLEELRWRVLLLEGQTRGEPFEVMKPTHLKSFARTIRVHMPDLIIDKLPQPDRVPVGIIARAAVFRTAKRVDLQRILDSRTTCIFLRYRRTLAASARTWVTVVCDIYAKFPPRAETGPGSRHLLAVRVFPATAPISVVCSKPLTAQAVTALAGIRWPLYLSSSANAKPVRIANQERVRPFKRQHHT